MSELIQKHDNRATIRWKLLTSASALALTAYVSATVVARAEDAGQPQIWIELGGQLSGLEDGQETFAPPLMDGRPSIFESSQKFEHSPRFSIDENGALSFQPGSSDWVFSASIRYGRSSSSGHTHQQTNPKTWVGNWYYYGRHYVFSAVPGAARFADTSSQTSERHLVLDFQAGKDVGLGMFGDKDVASILGLGVRFAQFSSKSNIALKSDPDWHFDYKYNPALLSFGFTSSKRALGSAYHLNSANLHSERRFHGVGPSLSWSGSAPIAGNSQGGSLSFDWALNAAVLFGRQRAKVHRQATAVYHSVYQPGGMHATSYRLPPLDILRSRNVTVPNAGGSVGLSWQLQDFKVSMGYRGDFFFGAMDGGIDTRKSENVGFNGPYASISIGLGD